MVKISKDKIVIYDIETLCNCITFCFLDYNTKKKKEFVLYDDIQQVWDLISFLKRLKKNGYTLCGFNNVRFDAQIIEKLLWIVDNKKGYDQWTIEQFIMVIYNLAQQIIHCPDDKRFELLVPEFKFNIPQIDLYLQKHYDRPQKATSLKWLQFTMRYHTVEEMPIPHDQPITKEDIPKVLMYNWNDVDSTLNAFENFMFETDLRLSLSDRYAKNLINASEPKLAREIFGYYLCKEMNITYNELRKMQTLYEKIPLKDIIFPYVKFENPVFNDLLTTLNTITLTPEQKMEYNINVYGLNATFALGGLHSVNKPLKISEDSDFIIVTSDVASMYPNLAIQNKLKPRHLGGYFNTVYSGLYDERKTYPKSDPINYVLKIILNSAYGLSSEKNSYLYDIAFTRAICINGELSLLMLCEMVKKAIPSAQFIMLNTDGLEVKIPRDMLDTYHKVCGEWEKITKLILEHGQYKSMYIIDVNNYMAVDIKGDVKKKGRFETKMDYHKNPSFLVIPKAVEAYFIHGKDYKEFIREHEDVYDFLGAVKKKSNFELSLYNLSSITYDAPLTEELLIENGYRHIGDGRYMHKSWDYTIEDVSRNKAYQMIVKKNSTTKINVEKGQKVTRYFISNKGKKLIKEFNDGRKTGIHVDWLVETANNINISTTNRIKNNVNYAFYIKEAEKIIFEIEQNANQLNLF